VPYIPDDIIETIRLRSNLVEIASGFMELKKNGKRHVGCCPFHHEKTPSFSIDEEKQLYYCFGCKKSGNLFRFVQEITNTDFVGAVRWLANRLNIQIPDTSNPADRKLAEQRKQLRNDGYRLLAAAANWFRSRLARPEAEIAVKYIQERGLDMATVDKFAIGYAPDTWDSFRQWAKEQGYSDEILLKTGMVVQKEDQPDRIYDRFRGRLVFTIKDELDRVVGFSARALTTDFQGGKYVNSPETDFFKKGEVLYGLNFAQKAFAKHGYALICEGQMDVIACHRAGQDNAVAAQGTAFTASHAALLKRSCSRVRLAFDGDEAGLKATYRTIRLLHEAGLTVGVTILPDGEDPDSVFRRGGPEALVQMLTPCEPAMDFIFRKSCESHNVLTADGKSAICAEVLEFIASITDNVARVAHCQDLARRLHLPEDLLLGNLRSVLRKQQEGEERRQSYHRPGPASAGDWPERRPGGPPAFVLNEGSAQNKESKSLQALLELTLNYRFLAETLQSDEELLNLLPDTPLAHALTQVLASLDDGEWEQAGDRLAESELSAVPQVTQVLMQPSFACLNPQDGENKDQQNQRENMLREAYEDCKHCLQSLAIDKELMALQEQMQQHGGTDDPEVLKRYLELSRLKKSFRKI
jgi:DNA primase